MTFELKVVLLVSVVTLLWLSFGLGQHIKPAAIAYNNANAALDRMKDWAMWLTGLQTAALAAMGLIAKGEKSGISLHSEQNCTVSMPSYSSAHPSF